MKLLNFRFTAAFLSAVLGVGSLAIATDNAPEESKPQEEANSAPAEASKKSASKKPRGLLVDSFFWPGGEKPAGKEATGNGNTLPGVPVKSELASTEKLPGSERGLVAPVVTAPVAAEQFRNAGPRVEQVLNIPAPPIVEAPSPLAQPASGPYFQPTAGPLVQPASWLMNGGPEVQAEPPAAISSNVACSCSDDDCCCCPDPLWVHRSGVFFDFLYLRPGNIDYIYAVEQTGPLASDVPTGHTGRIGFDGAPGYRVGATMCMSECSSVQFSYTWFNADTGSSITANPNTILIFQPGLPQIGNVGATSIQASATSAIRFQMLDLDYRGLLYGTCDSVVNYFAGVRYANLKQTFHAQEDVGVPIGLSTVDTIINFDGFGIGMGLDGMRRQASTGFLIYGRSSASFVSGEFKGQYRQETQFGPNSIAGNNISDYRVMSILQTELGVGWRSACGRVQLLAGYQFASWSNALTTATYIPGVQGPYIPGVQGRRFDNLNETLTFDGFTTRLQLQW